MRVLHFLVVLIGIFFIPFGLLSGSASEPIMRFFDVPESHQFNASIRYLAENNIVKGFDDGSFRPTANISRAAFTKIIIGLQFSPQDIERCIPQQNLQESPTVFFSDVPTGEWFAPYVCIAKAKGIINGFPDGTFGPEKNIAFPAAAKILSETFGYTTHPSDIWYEPYVRSLTARNAIPTTITSLDYRITRGDMAELVWRLKNNITDKISLSEDGLLNPNCVFYTRQNIEGVDMEKVRKAWLSWYNDERRVAELPAYRFDDRLNRTATIWSEAIAKKGEMSHKRDGQTAYYDYGKITDWFRNLDTEFKNINGVTFTENIGYGVWTCEKKDCTNDMINEIRNTFEFYLEEKNQSSRPHYDAIFNPFFKKIGLGIAINSEKNQYYITTHFAAEIIDSVDICK